MRSLILLRGLPGSGKSTLAKVLSEKGKHPVYSVDDYFTNTDGEYRFEFDKNHLAYKQCEQNAKTAMEQGADEIFIANTFTLEWELEPYFKLASEFNYQIFVCTVENRHKGSNIHHIPQEQIQKMAEKYKVVLF